MKIGILGSSDVAQALGRGFLDLGHEVLLGSRERGNEKAAAWVKAHGNRACSGTFAESARFGEILVLATLGLATENAMRMAGLENFRGKLVLDATNPLDFAKGFPPRLVGGPGDSGGEKHQALASEARLVKCFNTVGNPLMFKPSLPGGPPDMFICGNDAGAKERTTALLREFGWNTIDIGGIEGAHYLEAMCMVWVLAGARSNHWTQAFKLLRG